MNINKKCLLHFGKPIGFCFSQNDEEFECFCQMCLKDNKSIYNLHNKDCQEFQVIEKKLEEQQSFLKHITQLIKIISIQWEEIMIYQSNQSIIKNQYSPDILSRIEIFLQGLEYEMNRLSQIQRYFMISPFLCLTKYQKQLMTICNHQVKPRFSLEIESFYFLLIDLIEGFQYNFNFDNIIYELNLIAKKLEKQQNQQAVSLQIKADLIVTFKYLLQSSKKYISNFFNDGNQVRSEEIMKDAKENMQLRILKFQLQCRNQIADQNQFQSKYETEHCKQDEITQLVEQNTNICIKLTQQQKYSEANDCLDQALDLINQKLDRCNKLEIKQQKNQNAQDELELYQNTQCFQQGQTNFQIESTKDQNQIIIEQTQVYQEKNQISKIYILKGRILFYMKRYEEALVCYNKAIHYNKLIPQAYEEKGGLTLIYQKSYSEALDCFKQHIDLIQAKGITTQIIDYEQMIGKQFSFNNHDGIIFNSSFTTPLVIEQVEPLTIKQKILQSLMKIGDLLIILKNYTEAIQYFDKVIEIDLNNINAHDKKGYVLMLQHNYQNALKEFDLVISINISYRPTYIHKAQTLILQPNYYEALKCLKISLQLDKFQVLNYYFLGIIYYQKYLQINKKEFLLSAMDQFQILISLLNNNKDQMKTYDGFNNDDKILLILDKQIADNLTLLINACSKRGINFPNQGEILLKQCKINEFMQNNEEAISVYSNQSRSLILYIHQVQTLVKNKYIYEAFLCVDQGIRAFNSNNDTISVKKLLDNKSQILTQYHFFREQIIVQRQNQGFISKALMRKI